MCNVYFQYFLVFAHNNNIKSKPSHSTECADCAIYMCVRGSCAYSKKLTKYNLLAFSCVLVLSVIKQAVGKLLSLNLSYKLFTPWCGLSFCGNLVCSKSVARSCQIHCNWQENGKFSVLRLSFFGCKCDWIYWEHQSTREIWKGGPWYPFNPNVLPKKK